MISLFIYLYSFVLGYLGILLDILIPFDVPTSLNSVLSIFNSFWYYGLILIPTTTIIFGKTLSYSLAFIIALKIFDLMRLPFSWIEKNFTHSSLPSPIDDVGPATSRSSFGDVASPRSSIHFSGSVLRRKPSDSVSKRF